MVKNNIKEARLQANMTQKDVQDVLGVPIRTLQNWESGVRLCPEYVEEWLIEKMQEKSKTAEIRKEVFDSEEGFVCRLNGEFAWFFPVRNGMVGVELMNRISELTDLGWHINFCF